MGERNPPPDWIPGENCDLILAHADHEPVPLICAPTRYDPTGSRVRIHYEVYPNEDPNEPPRKIRHLWFRALIAGRFVLPDRRRSAAPAADSDPSRGKRPDADDESRNDFRPLREGSCRHPIDLRRSGNVRNSSQHAEPERSSTRREGYLARRSAQRAIPLGNGRLAIAPFPSI